MSPKIYSLIALMVIFGCGEESEVAPDFGSSSSRDMSSRGIAIDMLMALSVDSGLAIIDGTRPIIDSGSMREDTDAAGLSDAAVGPADDTSLDAEVDASVQNLPPIQIGFGSGRLSGLPFHGLYDYSQLGIIYLADELSAAGAGAGLINSLQFEFAGWDDGYSVDTQILKISHVVESTIPGVSAPDYGDLTISDTTVVKENFSYVNPLDESWEQFVFDRPFVWDGRSNILISWENRDGTYELSGYGSLKGEGDVANRTHQWRRDNEYPESDSSNASGRPNLKINSPGVPGHIH